MTAIFSHLVWLCRVVCDFARGLHVIGSAGPSSVAVFASARLGEDSDAYGTARALGAELGRRGVTVVTGGGPGLMEAVSRGVRETGGCTVGCRMRFPFPQRSNGYLDRAVTCRYFFVRKVLMFRHAAGVVVLPGGIGTLDELFELMTLIQTKKVPPIPIALVGTAYWQPLIDLLTSMTAAGTITFEEMASIMRITLVTDDVRAACVHASADAGYAPAAIVESPVEPVAVGAAAKRSITTG